MKIIKNTGNKKHLRQMERKQILSFLNDETLISEVVRRGILTDEEANDLILYKILPDDIDERILKNARKHLYKI